MRNCTEVLLLCKSCSNVLYFYFFLKAGNNLGNEACEAAKGLACLQPAGYSPAGLCV